MVVIGQQVNINKDSVMETCVATTLLQGGMWPPSPLPETEHGIRMTIETGNVTVSKHATVRDNSLLDNKVAGRLQIL